MLSDEWKMVFAYANVSFKESFRGGLLPAVL